MDAIFKALNDPARRALLDSLRATDGQTLTELERQLEMSRFGVMKHLKVLEDAHLVVARKRGRFKHHYLNVLPLQEVIDRWVAPFLKPRAEALTQLKARLERSSSMDKPDFVMRTFIRCTPDALWEALTDAEQMARWHFLAAEVRWEDDVLVMAFADGSPMFRNRALEVEPKRRIVSTFEPQWEGGGAPSRTVFLIEPEADFCKLTVEHYDLAFPGEDNPVRDGWARWADGLKTWLETGHAFKFDADKEEMVG